MEDEFLRSILGGTRDERESKLKAVLRLLHRLQQQDTDIPRRLGYRVSKTNEKTMSRVRNLVKDYSGPDQATMTLLSTEARVWQANPRSFWDKRRPTDVSGFARPQHTLLHFVDQSYNDNA
ncbi:Hypothetical protein R9X50_00602700 [Acrodontium crateriforme]|uniref:Uncharacterized protein n=1 Tax=Acrodontium crateriforme TaxID=150365 RepID=A0AAQ3RBD1_9PEZI|nr:Hypothetical protein R9X50_00602700 [Acrodontium crateriforme]